MCNWLLYLKQKVQQLLANTALNKYYFTRYDMILYDTKWYFFIYLFFFSFVHFLSGLFTYYLCWIYVLEVRINIIIIIWYVWFGGADGLPWCSPCQVLATTYCVCIMCMCVCTLVRYCICAHLKKAKKLNYVASIARVLYKRHVRADNALSQ